jgi:hypothetical protein
MKLKMLKLKFRKTDLIVLNSLRDEELVLKKTNKVTFIDKNLK